MAQPMESYSTLKHEPIKEKESQSLIKLNALTFYVWGGCGLLLMMSVVPVWNACILMWDFNWVFWGGLRIPRWLCICCMIVVLLYAVIANAALHPRENKTPDTILNVVTMFVTLLGFVLIIFSIPINQQVDSTVSNILFHCEESEQTHRIFEYSKVLDNIRRGDGCKDKWSVEQCVGYQAAVPYTDFIRNLENNYHCSGFCAPKKIKKIVIIMKVIKRIIRRRIIPHFGYGGYNPWMHGMGGPMALGQANMTGGAAAKGETKVDAQMEAKTEAQMYAEAAARFDAQMWAEVEAEVGQNLTQAERSEAMAAVQTEAEDQSAAGGQSQTKMSLEYPPTLFSDADYTASCEGMAARELMAVANDIASQTFYLGVYWVLISAFVGFLRLTGYCMQPPKAIRDMASHIN